MCVCVCVCVCMWVFVCGGVCEKKGKTEREGKVGGMRDKVRRGKGGVERLGSAMDDVTDGVVIYAVAQYRVFASFISGSVD